MGCGSITRTIIGPTPRVPASHRPAASTNVSTTSYPHTLIQLDQFEAKYGTPNAVHAKNDELIASDARHQELQKTIKVVTRDRGETEHELAKSEVTYHIVITDRETAYAHYVLMKHSTPEMAGTMVADENRSKKLTAAQSKADLDILRKGARPTEWQTRRKTMSQGLESAPRSTSTARRPRTLQQWDERASRQRSSRLR